MEEISRLSANLIKEASDSLVEQQEKNIKIEQDKEQQIIIEEKVPSTNVFSLFRLSNPNQSTHNYGQRLNLKTEKLQLFIKQLEAISDAYTKSAANSGSGEGFAYRMIAFTPQNMSITVGHKSERRLHFLDLPKDYFVEYECKAPGFRIIVDIQYFINLLLNIFLTGKGKCLQILDRPDNSFVIRGIFDDGTYSDGILVPVDVVPGKLPSYSGREILSGVYTRYPYMLILKSDYFHNLVKRTLSQKTLGIHFDYKTRALSFIHLYAGKPIREGKVLDANNVVGNPFCSKEERIVATTRKDPVVEIQLEKSDHNQGSEGFEFCGSFSTSALWSALKRLKMAEYVHLYLSQNQPLLIQYVFQLNPYKLEGRSALYNSFIGSENENAQSLGDLKEIVKEMMKIAPTIGTESDTMKVLQRAKNSVSSSNQDVGNPAQKRRRGRPPNQNKLRKIS